MTCPKCGSTLDPFDDRCPHCEAQENAVANTSETSAEPLQASNQPSTVPPVSPYLAAPGGTPPYAAAPVGNDSGTGPQAVLPPELSGFNVGALFLNFIWAIAHNVWLGLLTLVPIFGLIVPVVLGFKGNEWAWRSRRWESIEHFKKTQQLWSNWGWGVFAASIGCGWVPMLIVAAVLFPVFARARENARRASCQANLKQVSLALMQYTIDYDNYSPPARISDGTKAGVPVGWADAIEPYLKTAAVFQCPSEPTSQNPNPAKSGYSDYLYNSAVGGKNWEKMPNRATVFTLTDGYGTNSASNASYSEVFNLEGAPNGNPLHLDGINCAYADGHIKWKKSPLVTNQP